MKSNLTKSSNNFIPIKSIIMWRYNVIPDGWAVCNGQTVNGITTPNIVGKYVRGAKEGVLEPFTTGGSDTQTSTPHTHTVGVQVNYLPNQRSNQGAGTGITVAGGGAHTHVQKLASVSESTFTATVIPPSLNIIFIMKVS